MRVFFVAVVVILLPGGAVRSPGAMRAAQKVASIDWKKIEARKEQLACM